jgi:hypothetical protein
VRARAAPDPTAPASGSPNGTPWMFNTDQGLRQTSESFTCRLQDGRATRVTGAPERHAGSGTFLRWGSAPNPVPASRRLRRQFRRWLVFGWLVAMGSQYCLLVLVDWGLVGWWLNPD